jgi:hypothetical protein
MNVKFLPVAVAALLASTAFASADWRISVPNGPTPFLEGPSRDRLTEPYGYYGNYGYYGSYAYRSAYTPTPGYGFLPPYGKYRYWRRQ